MTTSSLVPRLRGRVSTSVTVSPSTSRLRGHISTFLLITPAFLLVTLLLILPIGEILVRSFENGLADYAWAVGHDANRQVFITTLQTAGLVTLFSIVIGYPYAYALTVVNKFLKTVLLVAVLVPFWTSLMIRSFSWVIILQENGALNQLLHALGFNSEGLLGSQAAVLIGMTHVLMPFAVLPMYAVMARVDRRLLSAARSLGARSFAAFRQVYLPLSLPGVGSGALLVFVLSMGFFITPALLGSPANTMASVLIETQIGGLLDFAKGGALSGVLLVLTLLGLFVGAILMRIFAGRPTMGGSRG